MYAEFDAIEFDADYLAAQEMEMDMRREEEAIEAALAREAANEALAAEAWAEEMDARLAAVAAVERDDA
jgi:hypothetical protein